MTTASSSKMLALLALLLGFAAISIAWGFQLIGGYVPCKLCLEQRVPFYVGLALIVFALLLMARGRLRLAGSLLVLVALVFAYSAGLGAYQAGAEWQFWAGPSDCGGGNLGPASASNMLSALKSMRVISCTEASLRFLGLSFAGWNFVASNGLVILAAASAVLSFKARGRNA
ncbi:disulfide bond formation protein B [Roseibium algae]|uniref:Disulfide bond formation protein B n=1 Tax=Roseibium algae TaxID=3123038 RepID=A0ABU8TQD6_9HYPH